MSTTFIQDVMKSKKLTAEKVSKKSKVPIHIVEMIASGHFKEVQFRYIVATAKTLKMKAKALMKTCIIPTKQYAQ